VHQDKTHCPIQNKRSFILKGVVVVDTSPSDGKMRLPHAKKCLTIVGREASLRAKHRYPFSPFRWMSLFYSLLQTGALPPHSNAVSHEDRYQFNHGCQETSTLACRCVFRTLKEIFQRMFNRLLYIAGIEHHAVIRLKATSFPLVPLPPSRKPRVVI
jgi:hypothetical protein